MRNKIAILLVTALALGTLSMQAKNTTHVVNDTVYYPKIVFTGAPSKYEIAASRLRV